MSLFAGQIALDTDFLAILAGANQRPICKLVQAAAQTGLANNTQVAITFTTEDIDTDGYHSTSVNTTRITPTRPGYFITSGVVFANFSGLTVDVTGLDANVRKNGVTNLAPAARLGAGAASKVQTAYNSLHDQAIGLVIPPTYIDMNGSTDYLELVGRGAGGGGTWATNQSAQFSSVLCCEFVRDL